MTRNHACSQRFPFPIDLFYINSHNQDMLFISIYSYYNSRSIIKSWSRMSVLQHTCISFIKWFPLFLSVYMHEGSRTPINRLDEKDRSKYLFLIETIGRNKVKSWFFNNSWGFKVNSSQKIKNSWRKIEEKLRECGRVGGVSLEREGRVISGG